jgi:hypothetical protein
MDWTHVSRGEDNNGRVPRDSDELSDHAIESTVHVQRGCDTDAPPT